jgi:hypothetical protein
MVGNAHPTVYSCYIHSSLFTIHYLYATVDRVNKTGQGALTRT